MYIEQAFKAKTTWWRYVIGTVIIFLGWQLLGVVPLSVVAYLAAGNFETFVAAAENNFTDLAIDPNLFLFLIILMFACGLLGLWFSVRFCMSSPLKSLLPPEKKWTGPEYGSHFLW